MNNYYLPFYPLESINYKVLLSLYDLAEYNTEKGVYDTIQYTSVKSLSQQINASQYVVQQILNSGKYDKFLTVDKAEKQIVLRNYFKGTKEPFVVLNSKEVLLIRTIDDNLFSLYLLYVKYYVGFGKNNQTDFTGKQFLTACGYCERSNSYLNRLNDYNKILVSNGIITIEKYRDDLGHTRNRYKPAL